MTTEAVTDPPIVGENQSLIETELQRLTYNTREILSAVVRYAFTPTDFSLSAEAITNTVDATTLPSERLELLQAILAFAEQTTHVYQTKIDAIMEEYHQAEPDTFTKEIMQEMGNHGFDKPKFTILDGAEADAFLAERNIGSRKERFFNTSMLLVFNPPKPIAMFWYYLSQRFSNKIAQGAGQRWVPDGHIAWGEFHKQTVPIIWDEIKKTEATTKLNFERRNAIGKHIPGVFYYAFEVSLKKDDPHVLNTSHLPSEATRTSAPSSTIAGLSSS